MAEAEVIEWTSVPAMKKVPRYRWFLWAAFLGAGLFFVIQMGFLPGGHAGQGAKGFDLLESLMRLIRNDYLEERDPVVTSEGTYRGLVNSLDPLSAYLPKELAAAFKARTGRETEPGVVVLKRYAAFPQVVAVVPKSPAEAAGIKVGDVLSAIGGRGTLNMSLAEVKLLLQGQRTRAGQAAHPAGERNPRARSRPGPALRRAVHLHAGGRKARRS